jgi:hypothetical protein
MRLSLTKFACLFDLPGPERVLIRYPDTLNPVKSVCTRSPLFHKGKFIDWLFPKLKK